MKINKQYIFMLFTALMSSSSYGADSTTADSSADTASAATPVASDDNKVVAQFDTKKDSTVTCQISPADAVKKKKNKLDADDDADDFGNDVKRKRRKLVVDDYDDNDDIGRRTNKRRRYQQDDERYDTEDTRRNLHRVRDTYRDYDDRDDRGYDGEQRRRRPGDLDSAQPAPYNSPYGQQNYNSYGQPPAYNPYGQQASPYGQAQNYNPTQPQMGPMQSPMGMMQSPMGPIVQSPMGPMMMQNPWFRYMPPGQTTSTTSQQGGSVIGLAQNLQPSTNTQPSPSALNNPLNTTPKPDEYTDADGYICKKPKASIGTRFKNFFGLGKEQRAQYAAKQHDAMRSSKQQKVAKAQQDLEEFDNPALKPEKKGALARLKGLLGR